jgi:hypothetical protein
MRRLKVFLPSTQRKASPSAGVDLRQISVNDN